eukprot:TRINITY_DN60823_c0_g1_i1.p1 TRINITY_DN60823_c0_g1~~TRINITY_DN60823_c0_g1_i1.p1  ORF type:complete len:249 (-),score=44.27 TRINITY_DN60823_c0_g1_i1:96-749(-)
MALFAFIYRRDVGDASRLSILFAVMFLPLVSGVKLGVGTAGSGAGAITSKSTAERERVIVGQLRANVQKAMLALYDENARARLARLPFGKLKSFGSEDTAAELAGASIKESNNMIDQIERAVVAETKRAMFRSLTRLRGVTVSSYDGMANEQALNIDDHVRNHRWAASNNVEHLAEREGNVEEWAFEPESSSSESVVDDAQPQRILQSSYVPPSDDE